MTKVGMTVLVKGLSFELENTNTSIVSLWPATGIQSAATERFKNENGESITKLLRKPKIFADAVVGLAKDNKISKLNGDAIIDEDYLRSRWGVSDFTQYRADPKFEPPRMMPKNFPSLKVEEENFKATFKVKAKL